MKTEHVTGTNKIWVTFNLNLDKWKKTAYIGPWPNGLASQHKSTQFVKPELGNGLAMGGQMDSQVGSQDHASRKEM